MTAGLTTANRAETTAAAAEARSAGPRPLVIVLTCVALVAVAYAANRSQPRPATVYLDDAWALIGWRAHRVIDFRRAAYTAFGFVLMERLWLDLVSFSAAHARWLTMCFTFASGPAFLIAALRMRIRYAPALLGAVILVTSPELVSMGTHVKQYSLDVLFSIVLIALAAAIIRVPDATRRWIVFSIAAVVALFCSFAVVGVVASGCLAALLAVAITRGPTHRSTVIGVVISGAIGLFAAGWYLLMLRPIIPTAALSAFWRGFYLDPNERARSVRLLKWLFQNGFSTPLWIAVILLGVATLVVAIRRPYHAVLFGMPGVIALGAALAHQAPIGSGRTDTWFYVPMVFMVISAVDIGLEWATRDRPSGSAAPVARVGTIAGAAVVIVAVAIVAIYVARDFPGGPDTYGGTIFAVQPDPPHLMAELEARRQPDDLVVTSPVFTFLYPLYGKQPLVTHPTDGNVAGWYPVLQHQNVMMPYSFRFDRAAVDRHLRGVHDVWLLDAPDSPYPIGSALRHELTRQGFVRTDDQHAPDARLERWKPRA